jgi:hypothetical protein
MCLTAIYRKQVVPSDFEYTGRKNDKFIEECRNAQEEFKI